MNLLLVLPKESAKSSGGYNVFPIGIAYVSAYLKSKGIRPITSNLEFNSLSTHDALKDLIEKNDIRIVATAGLSRDYYRVKEIVDIAKTIRPEILTVIGGGIISGDPKPAMQALDADIGVIGQGEVTMHELYERLRSHQDIDEVNGIIFRNGNDYIITPSRKDISDLDSIPFPDYDGFSYSDYMEQINYETAFIIASRSCPFKCTFCFHPSGSLYRKRSLDNFFHELDELIARYPIKFLSVSDELFAPKKDRVLDFCNRIKPYNLKWSVQLRVSDVDFEILSAMKNSGCTTVSYGIESADDSILLSMRKKIKRSQIDEALKLTYDLNMDIQGGLIFGDIEETIETANNSLKWHEENIEYGLELNMINIFPGTPLYNQAVIQGKIQDKVKFLKDNCPLTNVSKMSDEEYNNLASNIYERNMRAKLPSPRQTIELGIDGKLTLTASCRKCSNSFTTPTDGLHVINTLCPNCQQRHYLDPISLAKPLSKADFIQLRKKQKIAIWGAGEICIKILDWIGEGFDENFVLVDASKSRQNLTLSNIRINPLEAIDLNQCDTLIITVVNKAQQITEQASAFKSITRIVVPAFQALSNNTGKIILSDVVKN